MRYRSCIKLLLSGCAALCILLSGCGQDAMPVDTNTAFSQVLPGATGFEQVHLTDGVAPSTVTEIHRETSGKGYVIKLVTKGYSDEFVILCGVNKNETVTGVLCLSSKESQGKEKDYGQNFTGKNADGVEAVETIAGATMTTSAYKQAVQDALSVVRLLGSHDTHTEEQNLVDGLSAALPEGDVFTEWFQTELLTGVDTIFVADNGAGYVCRIGDDLFGVDANGHSNNATAAAAVKTLQNSTLLEINLADTGVSDAVTAVKKTISGNYVIDIDGRGYAYYEQKSPIKIRVSLTADGTIIDCATLYHEETARCEKESYYSQFNGKTAATYTQVDAIAGATYTNKGYLEAIERCFETVAILEGGGK